MSEQKVIFSSPISSPFKGARPLLHLSPRKSLFTPLVSMPIIDSEHNTKETPLTNSLEELLSKETLIQRDKVESTLGSLKVLEAKVLKLEAREQEAAEMQELYDKILDSFQNGKHYKKAKRVVQSINYSSGYMVDLMFDPSDRLISSNIDIRNNLKQDRHVTPILLVKQIILNSLQENASIEDIFLSLQSKIEVFKLFLKQKDNTFIQRIFDFFKHPHYQTSTGISLLIKILAHFYNNKAYLIMDDKGVSISEKVHQVFLLPSLRFGGEKSVHKGEGTFVAAALKFVKGMDDIIDQCGNTVRLKPVELAQVIYSIFSVFDYLPLPERDTSSIVRKAGDKLPNYTARNRYYGENIERLYQVAANHLHFVFEAYPALGAYYKVEILEGFLKYLAFGVSPEDLCKVCEVESEFLLQKKVDMTQSAILQNFTNKGKMQGFYRQYCDPSLVTQDEFLKDLSMKTKQILCQASVDYFLEFDPALEQSVEKSIRMQSRENHLMSLSTKYFSWLLNNNLDKFYDIITGAESTDIPIDMNVFGNEFLNAINMTVEDHEDKLIMPLIMPLKKENFKMVIEQLIDAKEYPLIAEAMNSACISARKASSTPVTSEHLNLLKNTLSSSDAPKKNRPIDPEYYHDILNMAHKNLLDLLPEDESDDSSFKNLSDRSGSFTLSSAEGSAHNSPVKKDKITTNKRKLDSEELAIKLKVVNKKSCHEELSLEIKIPEKDDDSQVTDEKPMRLNSSESKIEARMKKDTGSSGTEPKIESGKSKTDYPMDIDDHTVLRR